MNIVYFFIYIYLLLRPYYLFASGSLQISDIFLVFAFGLLLLTNKKNKKKLFNEISQNKEFLIFSVMTFGINFIYFLIYYKFKFILSSLYYIFNFMGIIIFSYSFRNNYSSYNKIDKIIKFNLIIQLLIYLLSLGKYYGGSRYMGTFNDPNQFGYYILISFCYIYIIDFKLKKKKWIKFLYLIICIFLIFESNSTGMLLGISIFLILYIIDEFKNTVKIIYKNFSKIILTFVFLIPIGTITYLVNCDNNLDFKFEDIPIIERAIVKIKKIGNDNTSSSNEYSEMSIWQERGYDKIYLYPKYIFYGAGEGEYQRFKLAAHNNEIHATFPSILFYYGIIPLIILCYWVLKNIKNLPLKILIVYIALFVESFFLLNQRQALFWIIIILGKFCISNKITNS